MSIEDRAHADAGTAADEFAWRAFRYVHGELTADEAEAFEEDLAIEQAAREALAQAVELTAALETAALETAALETAGDAGVPAQYVATRQRPPAQGAVGTLWLPRWSRRQVLTGAGLVGAGLVGAGIAACLAVAVTLGLMGRFGPRDSGDHGPIDPGNPQAALAEAWAGIGGDEWHDTQWHDNAPLPMVFSADADVADEDRLHADHDAELNVPSVPSWLLAALDPQRDGTPEIEEIKEIKQ